MSTAVAERPVATKPERNPLDVPYAESGLEKPVYYNPYSPHSTFYVNRTDERGNVVTVYRGRFVGGTARYETPRQEQFVRDHLTRVLNGNSPDRWKGDNLDEEDRVNCQCGFTTRNSKVALDHQKKTKHQPLVR
jgi:hypothetical protein